VKIFRKQHFAIEEEEANDPFYRPNLRSGLQPGGMLSKFNVAKSLLYFGSDYYKLLLVSFFSNCNCVV